MSGLKIVGSPRERVLRSVGDPPNGIIGVASPDGVMTLTVDGSLVPPDTGRATVQISDSPEGLNRGTTAPITVEEAVAACAGFEELIGLIAVTNNCAAPAVGYYLQGREFDVARTAIDLCEAVTQQAGERIEREGLAP